MSKRIYTFEFCCVCKIIYSYYIHINYLKDDEMLNSLLAKTNFYQ